MDRDAAFTEYAAARWRVLVRAGVLLGCSAAEAEDLAQQTLLRCYLKWTHVQRADDRDAYVARIQLNLLRQSRRRRWTGERASGHLPEGVADDVTGRVDDADALMRALAGLTVGQRQAVVLRYYLQLTEQQIADVAGVAPGLFNFAWTSCFAAKACAAAVSSPRSGAHVSHRFAFAFQQICSHTHLPQREHCLNSFEISSAENNPKGNSWPASNSPNVLAIILPLVSVTTEKVAPARPR